VIKVFYFSFFTNFGLCHAWTLTILSVTACEKFTRIATVSLSLKTLDIIYTKHAVIAVIKHYLILNSSLVFHASFDFLLTAPLSQAVKIRIRTIRHVN
jgi:hypothetical protein